METNYDNKEEKNFSKEVRKSESKIDVRCTLYTTHSIEWICKRSETHEMRHMTMTNAVAWEKNYSFIENNTISTYSRTQHRSNWLAYYYYYEIVKSAGVISLVANLDGFNRPKQTRNQTHVDYKHTMVCTEPLSNCLQTYSRLSEGKGE